MQMIRARAISLLSQIGDDTARRVWTALTFAAACVAGPAVADDPGFYTGISNGVAVLGNAGGQSLNGVPGAKLLNHDTDRLTATTLYGGYRFSRGFSLELWVLI